MLVVNGMLMFNFLAVQLNIVLIYNKMGTGLMDLIKASLMKEVSAVQLKAIR